MKKILPLLLFALLFVSCQNKYEKAIADFEQTIGDTKTDLNFKVIEIKEIKRMTVADSIEYCKKEGAIMVENAKKELDLAIKDYKEDSAYIKNLFPNTLDEDVARSSRNRMNLAKDKHDYALGFEAYWKKRYENRDPSEVLIAVVECKYSINNPFLNNAKQELTRTYAMSANGDVCYGRIDDNDTEDDALE